MVTSVLEESLTPVFKVEDFYHTAYDWTSVHLNVQGPQYSVCINLFYSVFLQLEEEEYEVSCEF
jgi:hypothetical protein